MNRNDIQRKVESVVPLEDVLNHYFGFKENGGRCPLCGERDCILPVRYSSGINGYECTTRGIEGKVPTLLLYGVFYSADHYPDPSTDAYIWEVSEKEYDAAVLDIAESILDTHKK